MGKGTFFTGQPVFTQLLALIPKGLVTELARRHQANRYYKKFMAYDHLVTMLYSGYFQCTSIREVVTGLKANASRLSHLSLKTSPGRSTLSDANARRPVEFFSDLYHSLYRLHFCPDSRPRKKDDKLFIIDSTTISLFSSIMKGAGRPGQDGKKKGGAKAHVMIDSKHDIPAFIYISEARQSDVAFLRKVHVPDKATVVMDKAYINYHIFKSWSTRGIKWVTRLRKDAYLEKKSTLTVFNEARAKGVISDTLVTLGRPSNLRQNPQVDARVVEYFDKEKNRNFTFVTNDVYSHPEEIADLYKRRWQVEMLFKRIKQRYPLRYFLGDNANAIHIQIWSALICDLLVKIVQRDVNKKVVKPWAYASISSMIKHHLMSYLNLREFLQNPDKLTPLTVESPPPQLLLFRRGLT
jgi:hypothetical protein